MFLRIVEWFAKRKGKQLAREFDNDPKVKKEIEELDATWAEFQVRNEIATKKIEDYLKKCDDEDANGNN